MNVRHSTLLAIALFGTATSALLTAQTWAATASPPAESSKLLIGIALPHAQLGQGNNNMTDVAEPVRQALIVAMQGPAVDVVALESHVPLQITAEARQKGVSYVLYTDVTQKKASSTGGLFKKLAPVASMLPMLGGLGGSTQQLTSMATSAVAQSVATSAMQASMISAQQSALEAMSGAQQSSVKRGDTIIVQYSLSKVGDKTDKKTTLESKAKQDGEDLLSPLMDQVATAVIGAVVGA
jgi:hypothetical protein